MWFVGFVVAGERDGSMGILSTLVVGLVCGDVKVVVYRKTL